MNASGMVERYTGAARENSVVVHGPLAPVDAVAVTVEIARMRHGGRAVACNEHDPLLERLGVVAALATAGLPVVVPEDDTWWPELREARLGVTAATTAVAETGTLVLPCDRVRPRATHLVPDVHVCLARTADIVATFADAIDALAHTPLPSNISWVSGPSRTSDLEMRQTLGIHGPRSVDVVLVDGH